MREQKSLVYAMRVERTVGKFVMESVISTPVENGTLVGSTNA